MVSFLADVNNIYIWKKKVCDFNFKIESREGTLKKNIFAAQGNFSAYQDCARFDICVYSLHL